MEHANHFDEVFASCIRDYQRFHDVDRPVENPFPGGTLDHLLYHKNWIDNIQWDLEDLIRDPGIDPSDALELKRRIDRSNQDRTDMVEKIDDLFLASFGKTTALPDARLNTESVAWALDRLSILLLKIHHMGLQAQRMDAGEAHRDLCSKKLEILHVQRADLLVAIDELLEDIAAGKRVIRVYRQMKMYNDPTLNPVLYNQKNQG